MMRNMAILLIFLGLGAVLYFSDRLQRKDAIAKQICKNRLNKPISSDYVFYKDAKDVQPSFNANTGELDLSNQYLKYLPNKYLKNSSCLISLNLKNNKLKEIPKSITYAQNLEHLNLSSNRIEEVKTSKLSFPPQLKTLSFSNNYLILFEIPSFSHLETLDLSKNDIYDLNTSSETSIKKIDLSNNNLQHFPKALNDIKNLEELDLSKNRLRVINSKNLYKVASFEYLKKLIVNNNELVDLPTSFGNFPLLEEINLENNRLDGSIKLNDIPKLKTFTLTKQDVKQFIIGQNTAQNLKKVELQNNKIFSLIIKSEVSGVEYLDLSHNKFKELPKTLPRLKLLKHLSLAHNQLTVLEGKKLPASIETLHLNDNPQLKYIPITSLKNLKNLKELNISNLKLSLQNRNDLIRYAKANNIRITF